MRKPRLLRLLSVLLLIFLALVACNRRGEDAVPTPVPTAVPPTAVSSPTPAPTTTPQPRPTTAAAIEAVPVEPQNIDWQPRLLYSSPVPGEEVTLNGAITIRFDQPMNQQSVEASFVVQQAGSDRAVGGEFSWPRPDTVVFTPRDSLDRAQLYRVRVDDDASGSNGLPLETPLDLELQTVGYLAVSQVIPSDGSTAVLPDTPITILFNRPVVPLTSTDQQADLPDPLTISPDVAGQGEWVSTSIYRFTPDQPLAGGARYAVTVGAGLEDVTGALLEEDVATAFTVALPEVVGATPADGAERVMPTAPIEIEFNMAMDRESTETAVSLVSTSRQAVPLAAAWQANDTVLVVTPTVRLALATTYQIRVTTDALAAGGSGALAAEAITEFTTVPLPAVDSTNPANEAVADQYMSGFNVNFASPMVVADFVDRIVIEPEPTAVDYFYNQPNSDYLNANFTYDPNETYRVTIPGNAADPYGNTLGRDYIFTFTAPPGPPLASFNLPPNVSQLSTSFTTQVEIVNRNVAAIDVTLYNLGLPLNLLSRPFDVTDFRPAADPLRTWRLTPNTPRDEVGVSALALAEGSVLPTGVYLLTAAAPELDDDTRYWQNQRNLLVVADTNIVVKEMFGAAHVWVTDIAAGQPAADRDLTLYNSQGVAIASAVSDANGFAAFPYDGGDFLEGVVVVSNEPGAAGFGIGRSSWGEGIQPYEFGVSSASTSAEPDLFAYIYTDRPIYRPGDTVYYKGIARQPNYGRYTLPEKQTVDLTLAPAFYVEESPLQETLTVEIGPDGVFSGSYTLPDSVSLGQYQLFVEENGVRANRLITVAQYRAPEFQVNLTPATAETLRGQAITVELDASFFFGGPAADLDVNYTVTAANFRPDVVGPFFNYGDGAGLLTDTFTSPFGPGGDAFLLDDSGVTDANGRFTITLPADLLAGQDAGSRKVTVEATVQTLGNAPVTARTSVTFHAADLYAGISPEDYIQSVGRDVVVNLHTVDWDGQAAGGAPVEVVFYSREWNRVRGSSFGFFDTRWEPVDTEVARVSATTDAQGRASASFVPESGGTYVAAATVTDGSGRSQTSTVALWVAAGDVAWRTDPAEKRMELIPDQIDYVPGDTARILVQSPFAGPVAAWLTIERGDLLEQRLITLQTTSDILDIPITEEHAPNIFVSVTAIKGVTPDAETNRPADIRLGLTELTVSPETLSLDVSLTPQQDQYGPGETAVYDVQITDSSGNPVAADVSLALVDLAVLTLLDDNAPPILDAFYSPQPYRSRVGSGLFIRGEGLALEIPAEILGRGGGGGAEMAATDARLAQEDDDSVRRDFPDTAFWEASIQTDADGRATVEIPLPDSLTTWRLSAKAATETTLVGQNSVDVIVSLPLLLQPLTPRFFTVGDVMQLGAYVNNNTASAIDAEVSLEADGVVVDGDAVQTVSVPANGRALVLWPVTVQDVDFADLTFRATGGGFRDATKPSFGEGPDQLIPVYRYTAADTTGTSGVLAEPGRQIEAVLLPANADLDQGSVDVTLSPSLAAALLDTLAVVNDEPLATGCAYALTDQLLPNVALATAVDQLDTPALTAMRSELDQAITTAITELEGLLLADGGWGWCYGREGNTWITAYTLLALDKAAAAGYAVDSGVLRTARNFLSLQLDSPADMTAAYEANRQAFFLYVLAERDVDVAGDVAALFDTQRARLDPYAKALLALAADISGDSAAVSALLDDLNESAIITAAGAHWEDETRDFRNLNSDVRGTAVVLHALVQLQPDNTFLPQAVRWLMAARSVERWSTFHETAWVTWALSGWMAATGELNADYDYALNVNLQPLLDGRFQPDNVTDSIETSLPLTSLVPDDINYFGFIHQPGPGSLYYTLYLNSAVPVSEVTAVSRGATVQRTYYDAACDPETDDCQPIDTIQAGERVRVELTIVAPNDLLYATVTDPIPAGAEAVDPGLATTTNNLDAGVSRQAESYRTGYWGWWFFNRIEYRDDRVVFLSEFLPAGTYQYTYFLDTTLPGAYQVRPAVAQETFFPELFGRSGGMLFTIRE